MKIILVNGAPRSGKDTIGQIIQSVYDRAYVTKFAKALKERAHFLMGAVDGEGRALPHDHFEAVKDEPLNMLGNRSWRQVYIWLSEEVIKPRLGERYWGAPVRDEIASAMENGHDVFVVTDSGFRPEAEVLIDYFGADQVMIVQVCRQGCTFDADSRAYVNIPGIDTLRVDNDGTVEELSRTIHSALLARDVGTVKS